MGKSQKEILTKWQDRIAVSRKWRDSVSDAAGWERFIDEYKGRYDVVLGNIQVPPINEVYAYTQSIIANLFYRNPFIAVNAKKTGTLAGAFILEAAVNHYWRELQIKDEVELEIMDAIHVGHGWHKTGNNVKTSGSGNQLTLESETLFSNRVSWRDMFFNVGCRRPGKDSLWMAHRIYRPTDEVNKEYGVKLKGAPHPDINEKIRKNMIYKDDVNFSAIYEPWDAMEKKVYLFPDETSDSFLTDPTDWPDYLEEFPFDMLSFNDIPDEPYPLSDIAPWEPQILEKIKLFTQMLNHVKRWNRQMLIKKGSITISEKDKFERGLDGSMIDVNGDPNTLARGIDYGTLPPDIYLALDRIDAVIRSTNGQPEFARGGSTRTGTRTLGELKQIAGGADARVQRKLDRIERHCANISRKLIANMKANFDVAQIVKITGKEPPEIIQAFADQGRFDPASQTIKFDKSDIIGEYDVSVKAGSTMPLDKEGRDAILDSVLQTSAQLASAPSIPIFIQEVIKERLRDYEIKGLEVAFDAQNQQAAQIQQQQLETQGVELGKVQAETAKRDAQAKQIDTDTQIKTAQAVGRATGVIHPELSLTK